MGLGVTIIKFGVYFISKKKCRLTEYFSKKINLKLMYVTHLIAIMDIIRGF
jgi:hypothetical protein